MKRIPFGAMLLCVVSAAPPVLARDEAGLQRIFLGDQAEGTITAFDLGMALRDHVVGSVASEAETGGDTLPPRASLRAFTSEGEAVGEMRTCTDLHGEAISGGVLVAGCAEGITTAGIADGGPVFGFSPYPDRSGATTGHLPGADAMRIFFGDYGGDALVVISPEEELALRRVALGAREVDTILDPARPPDAYTLTEDGGLNLLSAEIEASAPVTEPYSMEGHWRDPRPYLAMAGDLTVPNARTVRIADPDSLEQTGTFAVEGLPSNIIAVGGSGIIH